jgi:transcription elongation factor GreA
MKPVFLTNQGYNELLQKMQQVKDVDLYQNQKDIEYFLKDGNLKENIGYQQAYLERELIIKKIKDLEYKLDNSQIINNSPSKNKNIKLGTKITLENDGGKRLHYTLVGSEESDIKNNKLSIESILGQALLGCKKGDLVEIETPNGDANYKIINVRH